MSLGPRTLAAALAVACSLLLAPAARAGECYYLLMFATFVRATWPEGCRNPPVKLESITISWLPENLKVRTLALCPEPGVNLGLHPTVKYALANDERVSMWGPYQVEPELYALAARQRDRLESGQVRYKANDIGRNSARVSNCIHALATVVEGGRLRVATPGWGEVASYAVLLRYRPYLIDCTQTHPWVASSLGLDAYPIIYRDMRGPRSGALYGPLYRLFGGERDLMPSYGPPR
jgi:hypothetical protein